MAGVFKTLGNVGVVGLGAVALGVVLYVFLAIIKKRGLFPQLTNQHAYKVLRLIIVSVVVLAIVAMALSAVSNGAGANAAPSGVVIPGAPRFELETTSSWRMEASGFSGDDHKHLARDILTITNENEVDIQRLEARLQLPEPIAERPLVQADYADSEVQFHALSGTMEVTAVGGGTMRYVDRTTGQPIDYSEGGKVKNEALPDTDESVNTYSGRAEWTDATPGNTGIWELKIGKLPARQRIVVEFHTSDGPGTQRYRALLQGCQRRGATTPCFLSGTISYAAGAKTDRKVFFLPIRFDGASRTVSLGEPGTREDGVWVDYGVPLVPVGNADVVR